MDLQTESVVWTETELIDAASAGWPGIAVPEPAAEKEAPVSSRHSLRFCLYEGCTTIYRASVSGPPQDYCPEHRRLMEPVKASKPKAESRAQIQTLPGAWEVVVGDSQGDFDIGALFNLRDVAISLSMNYWEAGMVFRCAGKRYEVVDVRKEIDHARKVGGRWRPDMDDGGPLLALRGEDGAFYHGRVDGHMRTGMPGQHHSKSAFLCANPVKKDR